MTMTRSSKNNLAETRTRWRLIPLIQGSGKLQMTLDRWLLQQHHLGNIPPTLRFYTWDPVAISLGYHQRQYPLFWDSLTWQNQPLDIVRRPTGGRAVLHQGDLSYMIVTSHLCGKTTEVYQKLCQFLIEGWRSLGVELIYGQAGRGYIHNPSCFSTATNADLLTKEGKKLIGSAQLRRGKTVLQHGSMILSSDRALYQQVFGSQIQHPLTRFQDQESIPRVVKSLTDAASTCFDIEFEVKPLSEWEWDQVFSATIT